MMSFVAMGKKGKRKQCKMREAKREQRRRLYGGVPDCWRPGRFPRDLIYPLVRRLAGSDDG